MLSILKQQQNRLKNLLLRRISEDFEEYPVLINRILCEEAEGVDIRWKYGETFEKVYRMMLDARMTIENSMDPFNDTEVNSVLERYGYFISPTGRHIYGNGPKF